jgi:hypothetical protein
LKGPTKLLPTGKLTRIAQIMVNMNISAFKRQKIKNNTIGLL